VSQSSVLASEPSFFVRRCLPLLIFWFIVGLILAGIQIVLFYRLVMRALEREGVWSADARPPLIARISAARRALREAAREAPVDFAAGERYAPSIYAESREAPMLESAAYALHPSSSTSRHALRRLPRATGYQPTSGRSHLGRRPIRSRHANRIV